MYCLAGMKQRKFNVSDVALVLAIVLAFVFAFIAGVAFAKFVSNRSHVKQIRVATSNMPQYSDKVLGHAASSVDSERQYTIESQWKGQASKCYSCEADMESRCGEACVYNATKQKLFSV